MKRIFAILTVVALAFAACEPDNTPSTNQPGNGNGTEDVISDGPLSLKNKEVSVGCGNVMGFINYSISNPTEGVTIEAKAAEEWVNSFDYSKMGKVGFKADRNPGIEPRSCALTLTYGEYSVEAIIVQEGNPVPTEVSIEAPILTGHYYGFVERFYNFYLVFSDKGMSSYEAVFGHNYFDVPDAYYYVVDLYLTEPASYETGEPIIVPNGTYGFDKASQGWPNMFGHEFSWLQYNDSTGVSQSQTQFDDGTLVVEDGKVTLTVSMYNANQELEHHTITYEGEYELVDMSKNKYM